MIHFCFNDCIPNDCSNDVLVARLADTLEHYSKIKRAYSQHILGVITDRIPEKVVLNQNKFTLKDCIKYLDRDRMKIALASFGKFPVDNFFDDIDSDGLLSNEYCMEVNGSKLDATNAMITHQNGGVLFTLCLHDCLRKHTLTIVDKAGNKYDLTNQFGSTDNTTYVSEIIKQDILGRLKGFDKFTALIGNCIYDARFKSDFELLSQDAQNFLIKEVDHAIKRNAATRFYPDDKLIKDVTPSKEKEVKLMELRIYSPVALRFYFSEQGDKVYVGSVKGKPGKKEQTNDILNACSVVKELVRLKSN